MHVYVHDLAYELLRSRGKPITPYHVTVANSYQQTILIQFGRDLDQGWLISLPAVVCTSTSSYFLNWSKVNDGS